MNTNPTRSLSEHITEALSNVTESVNEGYKGARPGDITDLTISAKGKPGSATSAFVQDVASKFKNAKVLHTASYVHVTLANDKDKSDALDMFKDRNEPYINESVTEDSTMILEYLSHRISTPTELLDGLKEINAPIQIDIKNSSVSIDGVNYRVPKNIDDTGTSVNWDSKLYDALHKNDELTAMWKTVNYKYSSIINNLRKTKSVTGTMPNPEYIDWGTTGAANINSYFQAITKLQKMLQDILANKDAQDTLRKYEVLRHLFDRGYDRMFGLK